MMPSPSHPRVIALLILAFTVLLAAGVVAEGDDDVVTTIDVNFHHLGDHWVPTYQPQENEGTEYEQDFQVSGEVENPAIKMWIRGLVPPENVSIDYVRLYVNDELLGFLNEYAIGTGLITDVDDEVEIEVSIEEGILREGVNRLKVITGWGSSSTDRDDIMFWNIRLVRARPLEVSCNLLTPGPGDVHYPGLDLEMVSIIVWNDRHVDALQWVRVTVDPGGAGTSFRWTQSSNTAVPGEGATQYAQFPFDWIITSKDILNRTWLISATMAFRWTFPTDGPVDIMVEVRDDQTRMHTFTFEQVLEVPTDLELSGPVRITASEQGPLGPGSWVRGGEDLYVVVPPTVYKGSMDVHPTSVSVSLSWDGTELSRSSQPPGWEWSSEMTIPMVARRTSVVAIKLVDLPTGAGAPPPVQVTLEVDGRGPSWLAMSPTDGAWLVHRTVEPWADLTDGDGSGVDPFTLEFQFLDSQKKTWSPWASAWLVLSGGEGGVDRARSVLELPEGRGHAIRWRASDLVGNGPVVSSQVAFGIDVEPVVLSPRAEPGWKRVAETIATCLIEDPLGERGSGVDPSSVEVSVLLAGTYSWSDWSAPGSVLEQGGPGLVQASALVPLGEGGDNYVRWRARDVAGNGLVVSPPVMLMVDTLPPVLENHWPRASTFDADADARAVAIFVDGNGSGVDVARVEYAIGQDGSWEPTVWTVAKAGGDPMDQVRAEVPLEGLAGHENWILWRVSDMAGNGPVEFGPFQLKFNLPPDAVIARPADGSGLDEGDTVLLSGEGSSDPDPDDQLSYEWWSDLDGHLGSGPEIRTALEPGVHRILLVVTDGQGDEHLDEASVTVMVREQEPPTVREPISPWLILLLILVLVSVVAGAREWRARKRRRLQGLA